MTQRHKELLERHKTGQNKAILTFTKKRMLDQKADDVQVFNSKLAKPIDYSNNK